MSHAWKCPAGLLYASDSKVRLLRERHERELRAKQEAVENLRRQVREAMRDANILRARLEAIEGWRDHEILALRTASQDAVVSLKVRSWFTCIILENSRCLDVSSYI